MTRAADYEAHPAAELFPLMGDEELAELAADIKTNGQQCPVTMLGEQVLDGRNRLDACAMVGVDPCVEQYAGPTDERSLLDYVKSMNLARRHLTTSQRAIIAAKTLPLYEAAPRKRQREGARRGGRGLGPLPGESERATAGAAEDYRVSARTVDNARFVLERGVPELVEAVERRGLAVSTARELAKRDPDTQRKVLKSGHQGHRLLAHIRDKHPMTPEEAIRAALRSRYAAPQWALLHEVRSAVGLPDGERRADAVAMCLYPSRGLEIHGIEIKVARSDWLRELAEPEKAEAIARYCDRWWVAVSEPGIVAPDELPPRWGLLVLKGAQLRRAFPAKKNPSPSALERTFVASLVQRALGQEPA